MLDNHFRACYYLVVNATKYFNVKGDGYDGNS